MKNDLSHIILYAKGWYKRSGLVEDMRILVGQYVAIDPKYVSEANIVHILSSAIFRHVNEDSFTDLIDSVVFDESLLLFGREVPVVERFIRYALGKLSVLRVKDIVPPLDDPDYSILPSSRDQANTEPTSKPERKTNNER